MQHFCEIDRSGITVTKSGRGFKWKNDPKELTEEGFVRKGSPETCIMKMEQIVYGQEPIN